MWPTPPVVLWMQKTNEARDTPQSAAALNIPARDSCSSACMPHQTCPPLSPLPHLSSPPALPATPQPLYGVWLHAVGKTRLEGPLGSRQGPGNCHRLLRVEAHRGIWQVLALIKPRVVGCCVFLRSQLSFIICRFLLARLSICDDLYSDVKQTNSAILLLVIHLVAPVFKQTL